MHRKVCVCVCVLSICTSEYLIEACLSFQTANHKVLKNHFLLCHLHHSLVNSSPINKPENHHLLNVVTEIQLNL